MIKAKQMKFSTAIFKTFFLSLCMIANINFAYAQNAAILPNAKTTFVDQNGKPLTSGTVDFYVPSTTTRKTTWQDSGETIPNTNPVVLDAAGRALIWGDGAYRQVVKDKNGNIIWDQVTSSAGSSGSGGSTVGDGDAVGTIKPWSGFVAPSQYEFAYGQAKSRTSFSALYSAITLNVTVTCVGGSPTLTNISDTSQLAVGATIESICVLGSPTIISKTSNSVTLSSNATVGITTNARFFPYGNGDGLTTFNVPDLRGYVLAGRNNMGGVSSSVLNSTYFSSNSNNVPDALNAKGGNQSHALTAAENGPHNHGVFLNDPGHAHTGVIVGSVAYNSPGGATNVVQSLTGGSTAVASTGITVRDAGGGGGTANQTAISGSGTPISLVQPTTTMNYIIKVTPDAASSSFNGVQSIGGMSGVILCGTNVTCAGNTISVISTSTTMPAYSVKCNFTNVSATEQNCNGIALSASNYQFPVNEYGAGNNAVSANTIVNTDSSALSGTERLTAWIGNLSDGTGDGTVVGSTYGLSISALKNNWTTTNIHGQFSALSLIARGGDQNSAGCSAVDYGCGDTSGMIYNVAVSDTHSSAIGFEGVSLYSPTGGTAAPAVVIRNQAGIIRPDQGIANGYNALASNGAANTAFYAANTKTGVTNPGTWGNYLNFVIDDGTHTAYSAFNVNASGGLTIAGFGAAGTNQKTFRVGTSSTNVYEITNSAGSSVIYTLDNTGNSSSAGSVNASTNFQIAGTTVLDNAAWTSFSPTPTCQAGSATFGASTGRWKKIGKTVALEMVIPITAVGTCTGAVNAVLPFTPQSSAVLAGRENGSSGKMLQGIVNAGVASTQIFQYDAATTAATGASIVMSGVVESQ